jgi:hypothetical protein
MKLGHCELAMHKQVLFSRERKTRTKKRKWLFIATRPWLLLAWESRSPAMKMKTRLAWLPMLRGLRVSKDGGVSRSPLGSRAVPSPQAPNLRRRQPCEQRTNKSDATRYSTLYFCEHAFHSLEIVPVSSLVIP